MIQILEVNRESPWLESVKGLWRQNSKTLGFYADGAFEERASKGQILAAVDGECFLGYVVFFLNRRTRSVRLTHLCIDETYRGRGIARQLLAELRKRFFSERSISLNCRRDFDVCRVWPKLGFEAVSERAGKAKDGSELITYWMPLNQNGLFPPNLELDEDRLTAAIDLNILRDLQDPLRNGASETLGLEADWLQSFVQFCVTAEIFNEIQRQPTEMRVQLHSEAIKYIRTECAQDNFERALRTISTILGKPSSVNEESDQRHLARSIASNCDVFITRDGPVLDHADDIYDAHGLLVLRPSQLISQIEELRNEKDYQRRRLAETDLKLQRLSRPTETLPTFFLVGADSQKALEGKARLFEAHPERFTVEHVTSGDGKPLAVVAFDFASADVSTLIVPMLRLQKGIDGTRLAATLARALTTRLFDVAKDRGCQIVNIKEPALTSVMVAALAERGFNREAESWVKLCLPIVGTAAEICDRITAVTANSQDGKETASRIIAELNHHEFLMDTNRVLVAEHMLSPAKILGSVVRNFIIPIRAEWAEDLMDSRLSSTRLWRADSTLALSTDSVYYRSRKNSPFGSDQRGRLLWYMSDDKKIEGAKKLRAYSQLTGVVVGPPKDLFRRFRRFGVYEWENVLRTAGSTDGTLMAIEFTDTELFDENLEFSDVGLTLQKHGKRSTFQSPVEINEPIFIELYSIGTQRSCSKEQ